MLLWTCVRLPILCLLAAPLLLPAQTARPHEGQAVDPTQATHLFQTGSEAFRAGDLKTAHASFARLVRMAPRVAAAHTAFGAVLLAENDLPGAVRELAEAHRLDANDTQATINLAVAQSRLGHAAESVALFQTLPPEDLAGLQGPEVLAYAGALDAQGKGAEAETLLTHAVNGHPTPELLDALGTVQAQAQHLEAAGQSFERALAQKPDFAAAHAHMGSVLLLAGQPANAVVELRRAINLGATDEVSRLELGRALLANGQDQDALRVLRETLFANPGSGEVQYTLALALQASGQPREALPLFARVAAARPGDAGVLTNYGLALVQTGDARAGLAQYTRALALRPKDPTLHQNTGVAYLQMNEIDRAIPEFQAGLALDGTNPQLHYDLGLAWKLKDDLARAVAELERAEALDPKMPDAPYTLGVIRMQQGNAPEAAVQFGRAVALRPENTDAWSLLGNVQKDAGNLDAAAEALRHAAALDPEQPSPHVTLAAILAGKGDREGAAAERKTAAELSRKAMSRQRAGFALQSGRALLAKGELQGAVVQLKDAVAADPDLKEAHLLLAEALDKQGRSGEALLERQRAQQLPGQQKSP